MSEALAAVITSFIEKIITVKNTSTRADGISFRHSCAYRTDLDTVCNVRNSFVYDNLVDIGKVAVPAVEEQLSLFLKH